ncbi:helix-turn-helix transcriptional regulator [Pseudovibrio denitrificans]|uniref:helix-turn-helix transcriptional regulator n=1 Tax=Pseudovibrio denitrificans TaxID=258256 RepID=UPI001FCB9EBE|nr:HTH domain-containing protein [Pseudovibrio denitrificans]
MRGRTRPVSAEVIAERFGTSVRTIYRDIATLQSIGAPIRGEGGLGYQVEDGYFLPPLAFDRDEMDAVVLGLRMVTARVIRRSGSQQSVCWARSAVRIRKALRASTGHFLQ